MLQWKFRTYVSPTGRNDVQDEIDGYDIYGQTAFERVVMHLAASPKGQWNEPHVKKLKNEDPLYEIRYKAFRRQERAVGYFDDAAGTFVILVICNHKGDVYNSEKPFKKAHTRMEQIRSGEATTAALQVDGESFPQDGQ